DISSLEGIGLIIKKDFSNKSIFFKKQINKPEPIASLTKLMTAVVAWENIDHDKIITLSPWAISHFGNFGNFQEGEQYNIEDLIKGMLLSSSNDAAFALAEQLGLKKFVFLMNQKAKELGMKQTRFVDPAGLSLSNYSTAADLSRLALYILENTPEIFSTTKNPQVTVLEFKSGHMKTIRNVHKLAQDSEFLGGKTGFLLNLDKGGLLSLFRYREYIVCIIVLHGGWRSRYSDTRTIFSCLP
ncbi:MAG: D-alanyl-D-alanine carboxypeptidase, partial [Candidatus Diapherotrites archaeon]|nr:D-alanyl-D-alanine carboxypeptidase [Candidatus Diapherotrites archaeon]